MEERLQRSLARAGYGSRRACEDLIRSGRVTVNGLEVDLGRKVDPGIDRIEVDGHLAPVDPGSRYLMINKPTGMVTTMDDPQGRPTIVDLIPEGPRVFPVGRLDMDSEGLLLLTNDGELANRLTHPRYGVEKEYLVEVTGAPTSKDLAALRRGVDLEDGPAKVLSVEVVSSAGERTALRVVMGEGRKREVRRLMESVSHPVVRLVRVRQGTVRLGGVSPGEVRDLRPEEVRSLYEAAGL
ncbi:MAG: rRNA pseudouridine synthase [Actinobacteria bacterium]|nr:rRNA pseudouridine synthase [Actinomycetota bacterium]